MHPFEVRLVALLEKGERPQLTMFGAAELVEATPVIGASRMMPEFLSIAIAALPQAADEEAALIIEFACRSFDVAGEDMAVMEAVDILDGCDALPADARDRLFTRCLALAKDTAAHPLARAAGLDGAFRWADAKARRRIQLLDALLGVAKDDDPLFLARAAKIIGVAYSHWREEGLLPQLRDLADVAGVGDEAAFELGMAALAQGIEAADHRAAGDAFETARHWFAVSARSREQRPDAALYVGCLEVLTKFARAEPPDALEELVARIEDPSFQLDAWHAGPADPPWLGARHTEKACWSVMALHLRDLAASADEPSWYEPAAVIERHLFPCYTASRSILRRSVDGGVEKLVQPRIEAAVARWEGQAHALKTWLRHSSSHRWAGAARELLRKVDSAVARKASDTRLTADGFTKLIEAESANPQIPADARAALRAIISDAQSVHAASLTAAEETVLAACYHAVRDHPDYQLPAGRSLFHTVLLGTLRFLHSRLELTQKDEPNIAYLFARDDGTRATEGELQRDYYQFMFSAFGSPNIEVMNVGGGRADVHFTHASERLINEVKREDNDCSFEALERAFAAQTTDYQNVSLRLGLLLVLDQTAKPEGTPHLSTLVSARRIARHGEIVPRWVIIVKIPGQRLRPSDLTKQAKSAAQKQVGKRTGNSSRKLDQQADGKPSQPPKA